MILQLGNVPKVYDAKTGKIAKPNETLTHAGSVLWSCDDWILFHKGFVDYFMKGFSTKGIKYPREEAIKLANEWFLKSWYQHQPYCPTTSEFVNYFTSVGLQQIIKVDMVVTDSGSTKESELVQMDESGKSESKINLMPLWIGLGVSGALLLGYALTRPKPAPVPAPQPTPLLQSA